MNNDELLTFASMDMQGMQQQLATGGTEHMSGEQRGVAHLLL
jgi:hypothetical protein